MVPFAYITSMSVSGSNAWFGSGWVDLADDGLLQLTVMPTGKMPLHH